MLVPAQGTRSQRQDNLVNTLAGSATFQRLVGVGAGDADGAKGHIYCDLALDDGSMEFPRAMLRAHGSQTSDLRGYSWTGKGEMAVYVQYEMLTDDELLAWYSIGGTPTLEDHRRHMNNLFGLIADEMRDLARTSGCLEFSRIEEYSAGFIDPVTENGKQLVELAYVIHREGLP